MLLDIFDKSFWQIFAVHGENRLSSRKEDFEVSTFLRSKGDTLFGQLTLEFPALHRAALRTKLNWIVHKYVYSRKAFPMLAAGREG